MNKGQLSAGVALAISLALLLPPVELPVEAAPTGTTASTADNSVAVSWVSAENSKPGTRDWKIPPQRVATDRQMSAFADHATISRGDTFRVFASTGASSYAVRAYRMGYYQGKGARLVWQSGRIKGERQSAFTVSRRTRTVRAPWHASLRVSTANWPAGAYLLKLTTSSDRERYIPITVRKRVAEGDLVLMTAVTTYQAYNKWGGYSLYHGPNGSFSTRSLKVSYDRPYDRTGANTFLYMERGPIMRAERLGLPLAYISNLDLHRNPAIIDRASGLVSLGHDEYWTRLMKRTVERRRDRGMNVAFLGANALYWRVRLEDSRLGPQRTLVVYKNAGLDPMYGIDNPNVTVRFRDRPSAWPENTLTGMLYECYPVAGDLVIEDPGFFLYNGTGVSKGTRFNGLASIEVDRARRLPSTPNRLRVVAHSRVSCGSSRVWQDSTYYTVRGGGGVFSTGTMVWARTLSGPAPRRGIGDREVNFVRRVTDNLFRHMARGPLHRRHPSRGNLSSVY